ncbi:GFA family protein [Paraburkholderia humisilvae]|uniref:GFA family protein n=1 Tax=Paraburkholderia humisilvae TaxID=627669 RepID=UPI001C2E4103|nr:GFA family protein [Paraburkholderia humisilvae]
MAQQLYAGGCHCGAVRFTVDLDLDQTIACNCSNCRKRGLIFWFVQPEHFQLTAGEGGTRKYLFHKQAIKYQVCAVCGVETFFYTEMPDGAEMVAINARCIDNIDPAKLTSVPYDGASNGQLKALDPSDGVQRQIRQI